MSKNYWDLTRKERANLTEEAVKDCVPWLLMESGVPKATEPNLRNVDDIKVDGRTYFCVISERSSFSKETVAIFETREQAATFMSLNPMKKDYDYQIGSDYQFAEAMGALTIEEATLPPRTAIENIRSQLEERKEARDHNDKESRRYKNECEAVSKATSGLWEDWHSCVRQLAEAKRILDTFNEYIGLCDGNQELATTFLMKTTTAEEIEAANEYLDDPITVPVDAIDVGCGGGI